jgi:hypothetical protein
MAQNTEGELGQAIGRRSEESNQLKKFTAWVPWSLAIVILAANLVATPPLSSRFLSVAR